MGLTELWLEVVEEVELLAEEVVAEESVDLGTLLPVLAQDWKEASLSARGRTLLALSTTAAVW